MNAVPVLNRLYFSSGVDLVLCRPTISLQPAFIVALGDVVGACRHGFPVAPSLFLSTGACEESHRLEDPLILELEPR